MVIKTLKCRSVTEYDAALVYAPYVPNFLFDKWKKLADKDEVTGWNVYSVNKIMRDWIESQPREQWQTKTYYKTLKLTNIALSPELETWFLLNWS